MKYWIFLAIAVIFETIGTTSLKQAANTGNHIYTGIFVLMFIISFTFFWYALRGIDLSIAYASWAGFGLVIITLAGIFIFKEEVSFLKILFLALILIGLVGLKLISKN
ncbi:hypothetical protein BKH41_03275 [Helicobacter sp. 12S02232-10]|uniref:DMT family transporter n=1 Tax=Helicobacter sp. 12S02232-10 TaxID=1476197 RepID=UPI000BA79308|nr:multidrug efflux SMR transporter [Helicobacter sp. 12S02232-10]PAF49122.1 hypothetical protein BKH41_03275 [Helicobacter sp. 12S02232-10]